jgi:hypothetical protein
VKLGLRNDRMHDRADRFVQDRVIVYEQDIHGQ